ncbi:MULTISPECIES: thiazole biosynthesis adenylyltransferase ThiF [Exiguobacterium]|uniref:thiazole biosynthesis adenylyltransferase ThiF n=1 Tax=Exiguobacterium TaxID=33986 RepID=UPI001BECB78E|nr:thiazole biosynthesis adenylyltransferase ThiF [Exiguobacterium artemiae]MCT4791644.1 thiazole biosynthesis adenylyltransferase ThiF [Exiguobacterium artemiae]
MTDRYSRQVRFRPIGQKGQDQMADRHVVIIGAGALGTANAEQLVRGGVGHVTLIDRDHVEWSNLQRQQLYTEQDVQDHLPKAVAAKRRLGKVNSVVSVTAIVEDVTPENIERLVRGSDLMIDATDNFGVRMLINDVAAKSGIPWIFGACVGSYGMTYTIRPGQTPCLHCLLEHLPKQQETCETSGVISPVVQLVAAHQVTEALKYLTGADNALRQTLLSFDVWDNHQSQINVGSLRQSACPSCGDDPVYPYLNAPIVQFVTLCGRDTVQIRGEGPRDLVRLEQELTTHGISCLQNPYLLMFKADDYRITAFADGRILLHGEANLQQAKRVYENYFTGIFTKK